MAPRYTPAEQQWLRTNYGNEYHFLLIYCLKISNDEDREEGRAILRAMMAAEVSVDASQEVDQSGSSSIPTWYDESEIQSVVREYSITSMGAVKHLTAHLEHHTPTTDGSFGICIAGGKGFFVKQAVYESIPRARRPPLDITESLSSSNNIFPDDPIESIGSTIMPFILTDRNTGTSFRLKVRALVVPKLLLGMFIGTSGGIVKSQKYDRKDGGGMSCVFTVDLGNGRLVALQDL